ncbi:hypothetical protein Tco_0711378, partial [Tanacetum coccineum]
DKFKTRVGFDSHVFDSKENDRYKTSEWYHVVPPPYTGNFMPHKYDLVLVDKGEYVFSESVTSIPDVATSKAKTSVSKPKFVGEPLIEDWISDSGDENETEFKSKQRKPSFAKTEFVKSNEHVKTTSESVKKVENKKQAKYPRKNSQSPRAAVSVKTARPINTAYLKPTVNSARTTSNIFNRAHTHVRRPFNRSTTNTNSNLKEKVNTVKGNVTIAGPKAVVSDNKGNEANAVKASACWVWRPKQKVSDHVSRHNGASMNFKRFNYVDAQGRSKHITGNKSYLLDYEEIDGGFIAFKGDPKGGRITGKGKISTCKLDFEDVYFVKELKFNLFSVSQMCDKKNIVLFTDIECVVLSPDFKLLDETHVLLRVPIKDNMYSVDLKNIVPSGGLTCLFAKATLDESNLCYRRLGHINFKTLNKLATFVKCLMKKMYCLVVTDDYSREGKTFLKLHEDHWDYSTNSKDLDALPKSMNYKPVVAGNQTNGNTGTKENIDAGQARKNTVSSQEYILLPLLTSDQSFSSSLKDSPDAGFITIREEKRRMH